MSRMKSLMKSNVFWLSMDKDIIKTVRNCRGCALVAKSLPIKSNLQPKVDMPWLKLHNDFAGLLNGSYLAVVDNFRK